MLSDDDFEIKSKIYSFNLRLVLKHILHSRDDFFRNLFFTKTHLIIWIMSDHGEQLYWKGELKDPLPRCEHFPRKEVLPKNTCY